MYHQGTYPRTEPTVGQAHRIFFCTRKTQHRDSTGSSDTLDKQTAVKKIIFGSSFWDRKSPCPKSANNTQLTSSLYTQFPIENARASEGRYTDFADAWLNLFLQGVIWHNNWKKPVGVLQVLFQEYKNLGVLLWNPMKKLLFQPFSCVKFKTCTWKASVRG